jgi:hypothetical protein
MAADEDTGGSCSTSATLLPAAPTPADEAGFASAAQRPRRDFGWIVAFAATYVLALILGGAAAGSANPRYDVLSSESALAVRHPHNARVGRATRGRNPAWTRPNAPRVGATRPGCPHRRLRVRQRQRQRQHNLGLPRQMVPTPLPRGLEPLRALPARAPAPPLRSCCAAHARRPSRPRRCAVDALTPTLLRR